jgi:hypothetical protein
MEVKRMDAFTGCWVVGSFLVTLASIGGCWWVRRHPHLFVVFFMLGISAYMALAYWLGRVGGTWALAGFIVVVLISLMGCVWVVRSTRREPSSFDGYPFLGFIMVGGLALIALVRGLGWDMGGPAFGEIMPINN